MENNDVLIEYVLGGLSETERERLEQEYFVNDETWEKLRAVENDLIDSYVRGALPSNRRERFEDYFLASPAKRRRVEFARTLIDPAVREAGAEQAGTPKTRRLVFPGWPPAVPFAVAAAGLVLAVVAVFPFIQNVRLRRELRRADLDRTVLRNEIQNLQQQLAAAKTAHDSSGTDTAGLLSSQMPTVSVLLTPGLLRNGKNGLEGHVLPIPAAPAEVVLLLSLDSDEYPQYDVLLRTVEGSEIRHVEGLTSRPIQGGGKAVVMGFTSSLLPRGDYIATLSGKSATGKLQTVDSYTFSVLR